MIIILIIIIIIIIIISSSSSNAGAQLLFGPEAQKPPEWPTSAMPDGAAWQSGKRRGGEGKCGGGRKQQAHQSEHNEKALYISFG